MNKQTFIIIVDLLQKQYQIELDCAKFLDNECLFDNIGRVTDLLISEFYQDEACYSTECFQTIADAVNRNNSSTVPENTCIKHNIIDIYKFASSYITSCMREISMGNPKPFTHYEVSTNGFPKMMKLK